MKPTKQFAALRTNDHHPSDERAQPAQAIQDADQNTLPTAQQGAIQHQRLHGNASLQRKLAKTQARRNTANTVQRYQAGSTGHEAERQSLQSVGFTEDEAEKVYIGNWLRDFSQLIAYDNSFKSKAKKVLVPIIGLGEFGEGFSMDDLGVYVPSEHMDNPLGGTTVEDPQQPNKDYTHLSKQQKADQKQLDSQKDQYEKAAAAANLPAYIGRSRTHAGNNFKRAYRTGRNPEGLRVMGDGLHAVEDYFSHTNFTEIAIWKLAQEGDPKAKAMLGKTNQMEMAGGTDTKGRPKLVAGTYKPGGNDTVSLLETIKTQLETKQFIGATLKGLIRTGAIGMSMITEALAQYGIGGVLGVAGGAVGGVGGALSGAVEGAGKGMDEGAASAEASARSAGYSLLGEYGGRQLGEEMAGVAHYFGAATGAVGGAAEGIWEGAKSGAKKGWNFGFGTLGGYAGKGAAAATKGAGEVAIVGGQIVLTARVVGLLLANPAIAAPVYATIKGIGLLIDEVIEHYVQKATQQAAAESPIDPATGKRTITHSEIAKDAPEHPIWHSSSALADVAVQGLGRVMQEAWSSKLAPEALDAKVDQELDKYISFPADNDWWRARLRQEMK
jgi:hypothetical protein